MCLALCLKALFFHFYSRWNETAQRSFSWGILSLSTEKKRNFPQYCMAVLGDTPTRGIMFAGTVEDIAPGEELTADYNGGPDTLKEYDWSAARPRAPSRAFSRSFVFEYSTEAVALSAAYMMPRALTSRARARYRARRIPASRPGQRRAFAGGE